LIKWYRDLPTPLSPLGSKELVEASSSEELFSSLLLLLLLQPLHLWMPQPPIGWLPRPMIEVTGATAAIFLDTADAVATAVVATAATTSSVAASAADRVAASIDMRSEGLL
jgi:hypothetical protein